MAARFVDNHFSEKYLTTIGVRVDTKVMEASSGTNVKLAVWDLAGTDTPTGLFLRYLRGASGYLLVVDGTRAETLEHALALRHAVESELAPLPFVGLVNKSDLREKQEIGGARLAQLRAGGENWLCTSALSGENVEEAFGLLLAQIEPGP